MTQAFLHVLDDDPLAPLKMAFFIELRYDPSAKQYFGRSAPSGDRLELTLTATANPQLWNARIDVWDTWRLPETFLYSNIFVRVDRPFATPSFGGFNISGHDVRIVQVKE